MAAWIENYGPLRDWLKFDCPRRPGYVCKVPLKPWPINVPTWDHDGNKTAPTVTPSVNCGSCGWHGHIVSGECVPKEGL
jgi:hypothetical protein